MGYGTGLGREQTSKEGVGGRWVGVRGKWDVKCGEGGEEGGVTGVAKRQRLGQHGARCRVAGWMD